MVKFYDQKHGNESCRENKSGEKKKRQAKRNIYFCKHSIDGRLQCGKTVLERAMQQNVL